MLEFSLVFLSTNRITERSLFALSIVFWGELALGVNQKLSEFVLCSV